jgi:hypothetical protein
VATFFPGVTVLGLGMGLTVAPLTTAVMGSVDPNHADTASGINNAISRAAGLLAVAALGVVLVARFDGELDRRLAAIAMSPEERGMVAAERSKLAAAELPSSALKEAFDESYVAGFRALMIACAALGVAGAISGLAVARD